MDYIQSLHTKKGKLKETYKVIEHINMLRSFLFDFNDGIRSQTKPYIFSFRGS